METITTIWKGFKAFMGREWSSTEKMMLLLNAVLFGMILGFFIAPVRRRIYYGNNSGNSYGEMLPNPAAEEYWPDDED